MTKKKLNLGGIFPPIPTSFDKTGALALDQVRSNIAFLNKFDLQGYFVLGSNGEFVLLDEDEKITLIQTVREATPSNKLLLAGVGFPSTSATVRLCQSAADE